MLLGSLLLGRAQLKNFFQLVDLTFKFLFEDELGEKATNLIHRYVHLASQESQFDGLVRSAYGSNCSEANTAEQLIQILSDEGVTQKVHLRVIEDFLNRVDVVFVEACHQGSHRDNLGVVRENFSLMRAQHIKVRFFQ